MEEKEFCPWVEKHRPKVFENIVLDDLNRRILKNIIHTKYFPNLLLYGPPGTGKTTTIINLIKEYDKGDMRELMIHLNASDERGIDMIRNQISQFVNAENLFAKGMKFVVLDEVDYMTKNAQQALRYLLQNNQNRNPNVRFCLICNYISKIDEGLQNEFLKLRFNQLPEKEIMSFLKRVCKIEKIHLTDHSIKSIIAFYKSDIRSMLNFLQSNQDNIKTTISIINPYLWEKLIKMIQGKDTKDQAQRTRVQNASLNNISLKYNIDKRHCIKEFLNYLIRKHMNLIKNKHEFLSFVQECMHVEYIATHIYTGYFFTKIKTFL
jgi:replication factor C subunit 3/5